jgi:hypothetical protein
LRSKVAHQGFLRPTCWKVGASSEQSNLTYSYWLLRLCCELPYQFCYTVHRTVGPVQNASMNMLSAVGNLVPSPTIDLGMAKGRNVSTTIAPAADSALSEGSVVSPATRATLNFQYASLRNINHCPTGIYITPSVGNTMVWDAVLFVHKGSTLNACWCAIILSRIHHFVRVLPGFCAEIHHNISKRLS